MASTTTIRLTYETIDKLRAFKKHPRVSDDEALNSILKKLESSDKEIIKLHKEIVELKEEKR